MNRLGLAIQFAHAGLTAEGDNRVLMQKVTKEVMALAQQGKHRIPKVCPPSIIFEIFALFHTLALGERL